MINCELLKFYVVTLEEINKKVMRFTFYYKFKSSIRA